MPRICTWNMRHATRRSAEKWAYFASLNPDLALLQEVNSIPDSVSTSRRVLARKAYGKTGRQQKFSTVVMVRGTIVKELLLSSLLGLGERRAPEI